MLRILFVFALIATALPLAAQSLEYRVDLTNSRSKRVHVTVIPRKLGAETVTYQMPAWAPGAYSVTNYGRYVQDFQAFDLQGKPLTSMRIDQNRWSIANAKAIGKIDYYVADSRRDTTSLWFAMAHVDSNLFFANGTALFGYVNDRKTVASTVTYVKPVDWEIATALEFNKNRSKRDCAFKQVTFKAKDYDELVDAPVLAAPELQTRCFQQQGALYEIVLVSNKGFAMDSLEDYTKKIVRTQTSFFGETPFKHYTFLYYTPSFMQMPSMGQGALEHMNSSAYLMMHQPWDQFKEDGLRIIAHEFFHLWNVKRIHSSLLGPFDYTKGVRTSSLWLSEGITDYYAHALLARNGLITANKFLSDVRGWYSNYRHSTPALTMSLEELSRAESDFDMENAIVLYTKGPLVGLMLDLEIRTRTNNKRSLDDIMLALNKDAKKRKYFTDEALIGKMGKIVGLDLSDFYRRYIQGTDSIHIESVLDQLGLSSKMDLSSEITSDGDKVKLSLSPAGEMVIDQLPSGSLLFMAGFRSGDTVVSLNGAVVTPENISHLMQELDPDVEQTVIVRRADGQRTIRFTPALLQHRRTMSGNRSAMYSIKPDQTPLQMAIREAIMGKM